MGIESTAGYPLMRSLDEEQTYFFTQKIQELHKKFRITLDSNEITIKTKIHCPKCQNKSVTCLYSHKVMPGHKRPDLLVDVDDIFEWCENEDCNYQERETTQVYQTNPELRLKFCKFCGRLHDSGDLKVQNRSSD